MSEKELSDKHPGRPALFNTPEELQTIIDAYFKSCGTEVMKDSEGKAITNKSGQPVFKVIPPSLTGLALALGFCSRQSIYDYENRNDEFSYTIKKARLRCENFAENGILSGEVFAASGIFVLKNYGWSDKQEIDLNGDMSISINIKGVDTESTEK